MPTKTETESIPSSLSVKLTLRDPELISEVCSHPDNLRDDFLFQALRLGILTLRQASGQIDADLIHRESDRLLEHLNLQLTEHSHKVHGRVADVLKEYFDPDSGHLQHRFKKLLKDGGELEQILQAQVGDNGSQLSKTLDSHFGNQSELMKWLSPDQSQGLLGGINKVVEQQSEAILKQFSLDNKESALCRFIVELETRQEKLRKSLDGKISDMGKEFSLDEENSALSRLVKNIEQAEAKITAEFSLDEDKSALARMRKELLAVLKDQREENQSFQEEVKVALKEMTTRKKEAARSTRHGDDFEESAFLQIQSKLQPGGDITTRTGNSTGRIKNCKVGDVLIELGPENVAFGARIAVEVKEDSSYGLSKARAEIEVARKNRNAQVGLFLFSKKSAPEELEPISRYGNDVFVIWDSEDTASDLFLTVGLTLARALCIREGSASKGQEADFVAIEQAILEIEKRSGKLDDIGTWAKTAQSSAEKIIDRVEKTRKALSKQVEILNEKISDLKRIA